MASNQIGLIGSVSQPLGVSIGPETKKSSSVPGAESTPQVGQPFNPSRKICGFYAPDVVGRQRDLTDGSKRLYERGVRWAGNKGSFWYGFDTMAAELGKSPRQVKRDMADLERYGLISHARRRRQSNRYLF